MRISKSTDDFDWPVDQAGYEIVPIEEGDDIKSRTLCAKFFLPKKVELALLKRGKIQKKRGEQKKYLPLEEFPGLSRQLSSLYSSVGINRDPSDSDIIEFASKYGMLFGAQYELVRDWVLMSKYFHSFACAIDKGYDEKGNKFIARDIFNQAVTPSMTVRLIGHEGTANWRMGIVPTDLIGALWLQIAQELTTGTKMQKCEAPDCKDWFSSRANKKFCNNRCRTSHHRHTNSDKS